MTQRTVKTIQASNIEGSSVNLYYVYVPDECPLCFVKLVPRLVTGAYGGEANKADSFLQLTYQCTQLDCQQIFITSYVYTRSGSAPHDRYEFVGVAPRNPPRTAFPDSVENISPEFISIYNQAIAAEVAGLDQIAGIGLRKALEFLVKDFLIHEKPSDAETIKNKFLGLCINEDVTDANVKACAARATWLGNDETHYVRKWIDKDINDLKTLVRLTVNWIDNVLLTQDYLKEMDPANLPVIPVNDTSVSEV